VAELALGHRLALQRLDDIGIGFAVGDQLFESAFVDRREAAGQGGFGGNSSHWFSPLERCKDTERSVALQKACQRPLMDKTSRYQ
jgi:hypothetical protein